ncbi:hypothetical protein [Gynuella sunshinyii]|uniref:Uncharacterized protein n=1 Tax=Gynuella sunshinyii YC6258 TaxID=1445510 RepID=A0A0C5VJL4_9GAMM|nr:hypothetical protein [Gynuella sunshinyii]AJQ94842.1 hypothetical Protein YC6258_02804 [Gynuella sunshinyii YC6258]
MKPEEFVKKIRQSVLDENIAIYKDLFANTEIDQASDPYWQEALGLFKKLGDKEKETLFKIMRQVSVDTISNLFALLDGVSCLEDQDGDFSLTIENEKKQLNGDLQDIFLEIEEDL